MAVGSHSRAIQGVCVYYDPCHVNVKRLDTTDRRTGAGIWQITTEGPLGIDE